MSQPNERPARPQIVITGIDSGAPDLAAQLPLRGELYGILPGSDRPDYSLAGVNEPITFHTTVEQLERGGVDVSTADPRMIKYNDDGTVDLIVFGLVLCARISGQTINLSMKDLPVNIAYIIDNSQMMDSEIIFSKSYFAAVGFISMAE